MASITFAQFLYGIMQHESGGNYAAVSPDGALGRWQIMPGNIASWSKQILGYSITPQQFMQSPQLQDAIGVGMLGRYFQQYGAQGAASAWLTGDPNKYQTDPGSGDRNGSVSSYISAVLGNAQSYQGNGSDFLYGGQQAANYKTSVEGNTLTPTASNTQLTPAQLKDQLTSDVYTLVTTIPELKQKFDEAMRNNWPAADFLNAIHQTTWWKTHSESVRQTYALRAADPAEYQKQLQDQRSVVNTIAAQLGVHLSDATLGKLTAQSMWEKWSQQQVIYALGKAWTPAGEGKTESGQAAQFMSQIKSTAQDYGVALSPGALVTQTRAMLSGVTDINAYLEQAKLQAKSIYPALAAQIDGGMTVKQIADPYITSYANLLEVDPGTVNWTTDPLIKRALQGQPTEAGKPPVTTPVYNFEEQVKNDPRWGYTNNAHAEGAAMLRKLGQDWGFAS